MYPSTCWRKTWPSPAFTWIREPIFVQVSLCSEEKKNTWSKSQSGNWRLLLSAYLKQQESLRKPALGLHDDRNHLNQLGFFKVPTLWCTGWWKISWEAWQQSMAGKHTEVRATEATQDVILRCVYLGSVSFFFFFFLWISSNHSYTLSRSPVFCRQH